MTSAQPAKQETAAEVERLRSVLKDELERYDDLTVSIALAELGWHARPVAFVQPCNTDFKAKGEGRGATQAEARRAANTNAYVIADDVCRSTTDCKHPSFRRYEEVELVGQPGGLPM